MAHDAATLHSLQTARPQVDHDLRIGAGPYAPRPSPPGALLVRVCRLTPYSRFWIVNSTYRGVKFTTESAEGWLIMDS
jgi:hypothetical protein